MHCGDYRVLTRCESFNPNHFRELRASGWVSSVARLFLQRLALVLFDVVDVVFWVKNLLFYCFRALVSTFLPKFVF